MFDPQPEKGKHVQTATVNVFGYKLEFVQLRSDLYACKSILPCEVCSTCSIIECYPTLFQSYFHPRNPGFRPLVPRKAMRANEISLLTHYFIIFTQGELKTSLGTG